MSASSASTRRLPWPSSVCEVFWIIGQHSRSRQEGTTTLRAQINAAEEDASNPFLIALPLACALIDDYIRAMGGRVIQSSGPPRYAIVDGMNMRDRRVHNYPPPWNAAPSRERLVIRRNHKTGELSLDPLRCGLIPYWCSDPNGGRKPINAKFETVRDLPTGHAYPAFLVAEKLNVPHLIVRDHDQTGGARQNYCVLRCSSAIGL